MARLSVTEAGGANRLSFLDLIAWSEGTSTSPITKDDGYDIIVTGVDGFHRFDDYSHHPDMLVTVNSRGLKSTAAGRYQQIYFWWLKYRLLLKLPDFSPLSQDKCALQQIREQGAIPYIDSGDIASAITRCSNIWASFPGNTYGQRQHPLPLLVAQFHIFRDVTSP